MTSPISPKQAERLESIFAEVVELDTSERRAYLDQTCGDDTALRTEVESLLEAFEAHVTTVRRAFGELPLAQPGGDGDGTEEAPLPTVGLSGKQVGRYRILDKLGGGGMGVVYQAYDSRLERTVALKFLPRHLNADPEAEARFTQEAQAASALDHTNICAIHDIGETDGGQLYIAMAYYRGETLKAKSSGVRCPLMKR